MSVACMHLAGVPAYHWLLADGCDVAVLYHLLQQSTGIYDLISTAASTAADNSRSTGSSPTYLIKRSV